MATEKSREPDSFVYNDLIPELYVTDYQRSLNFYTKILPFKAEYSRPEKPFAFLSLGRAQLMIEQVSEVASDQEFQEGHWKTGVLEYPLGRGMNLSIEVASVHEIIRGLSEAQYPLKMEPKDAWYRKDDIEVGERQFLVMDPDGYLLRFQQSLGQRQTM